MKSPTSFGVHPNFLPHKFTVESSQPYGCFMVLYYYDFCLHHLVGPSLEEHDYLKKWVNYKTMKGFGRAYNTRSYILKVTRKSEHFVAMTQFHDCVNPPNYYIIYIYMYQSKTCLHDLMCCLFIRDPKRQSGGRLVRDLVFLQPIASCKLRVCRGK